MGKARGGPRVYDREQICRLRATGMSVTAVAAEVGCARDTVYEVVAAAGGLPPRRRGRGKHCLSAEDREEISRGLAGGESLRGIAVRLGRAPSTVSREVKANGGRPRYRAWSGERRAFEQAARPKPARLAERPELRAVVETWLAARWSPEQIARRLRNEYPDDPEMWVSHETIYQSLYVQGRGALRKELASCLRSGRAQRRPRDKTGEEKRGHIPGMVNISERPPEVADRAVPGHWEGDLIVGAYSRSAIATLVERTTRFVVLLHLPNGHGAEAVLEALTTQVLTLPAQLRRSLTWDQGKEMAAHARFSVATGVAVYFCDPHSPWQRGSNENTNGLLRQYFPKGTDLSVHTQANLDAVAAELNGRPRQTLGWMKPCEKLAELVAPAA
jgi:IS30 family transposase